MSPRPRLEQIEALIWSTGTRDQVLVARILRAVRTYAAAADCPPDPAARAEILARAAVVMPVMDSAGQLTDLTLADVLGEDESGWWPR
jgi:hypothetical protein